MMAASNLPPYSTFRTDNKAQILYPQATSHGNILSFKPPGLNQILNIKFPDSRLAVCEKCKKNYKTRDMCRVRNNHTDPPWSTAYICITLDLSCIDSKDGKIVDKPFHVRMDHWQPYCVKKPFDSKTPVCAGCKKTNRTRSFCRERHQHRQLPWCTVYVTLTAAVDANACPVAPSPEENEAKAQVTMPPKIGEHEGISEKSPVTQINHQNHIKQEMKEESTSQPEHRNVTEISIEPTDVTMLEKTQVEQGQLILFKDGLRIQPSVEPTKFSEACDEPAKVEPAQVTGRPDTTTALVSSSIEPTHISESAVDPVMMDASIEPTTVREPTDIQTSAIEPSRVDMIPIGISAMQASAIESEAVSETAHLTVPVLDQATIEQSTVENTIDTALPTPSIDLPNVSNEVLEVPNISTNVVKPVIESSNIDDAVLQPASIEQVLESGNITENTFEPSNISEHPLEVSNISAPSLEHSDISESALDPENISESVHMSRTTVGPENMSETTLEPANINEATYEEASIIKATSKPASINESTLEHSNITEPTLEPSELAESSIEPTTINDSALEPAALNETVLESTNIHESSSEPKNVNDSDLEPEDINEPTLEPTSIKLEDPLEPSNLPENALEPTNIKLEPSSNDESALEAPHAPSSIDPTSSLQIAMRTETLIDHNNGIGVNLNPQKIVETKFEPPELVDSSLGAAYVKETLISNDMTKPVDTATASVRIDSVKIENELKEEPKPLADNLMDNIMRSESDNTPHSIPQHQSNTTHIDLHPRKVERVSQKEAPQTILPPSKTAEKSIPSAISSKPVQTTGKSKPSKSETLESDDIHKIEPSRTFLAKVSCKGITIHWLELAEFDSNSNFFHDGGVHQAINAMRHPGLAPMGVDPSQAYYPPNVYSQQHQHALKMQQQHFFQMHQRQQQQFAAWQAYNQQMHMAQQQQQPGNAIKPGHVLNTQQPQAIQQPESTPDQQRNEMSTVPQHSYTHPNMPAASTPSAMPAAASHPQQHSENPAITLSQQQAHWQAHMMYQQQFYQQQFQMQQAAAGQQGQVRHPIIQHPMMVQQQQSQGQGMVPQSAAMPFQPPQQYSIVQPTTHPVAMQAQHQVQAQASHPQVGHGNQLQMEVNHNHQGGALMKTEQPQAQQLQQHPVQISDANKVIDERMQSNSALEKRENGFNGISDDPDPKRQRLE